MSVLVLAHDGPEKGLIRAALSGLPTVRYDIAASWDEFMQTLVANRPTAVILAHSTLFQSGDAGIKAADMTLRALNVPTVIALSHADKEARFPIEMETEFEHFLVEPYGPKGLARTISSALGLKTGSWPVASDSTSASQSGTNAAPPAPAAPATTPEQPAATVESAAGSPAPAPPEPATPSTIHAAPTPANPLPAAGNPPLTPDEVRAPNAASFFGSVLEGEELDRVTKRETTQVELVPSSEFDSPQVSAVMDALFSGPGGNEADTPASVEAARPDATEAPSLAHELLVAEAEAAEAAAQAAAAEPNADDPGSTPDSPAAETTEDTTQGRPIPAGTSASVSGPSSTRLPSQSGANAAARASVSNSISVERSISPPASSSGAVPRLSLALPDPNVGDLSMVHLPRVLYALAIARATGELRVRTASLHRRIVLLQGEPGTVFKVPTADDERKLLSTFQWSSGEYHFESKEVPEAQFYTFGEPLELISRGIHRHFGLNETATALGAYLKKYPVVTDQMTRFKRVLGLEGFADVARSLDGRKTLEERMMTAGADTEAVLRHIFFAWLTGVAIFLDEPSDGPVKVTFEIPSVHSGGHGRVERSATVSGTHSGVRSGSYNSPTIIEAANSAPATDDNSEQQAVFDELRARWDVLSTRTRHEVFGLTPGCGPEEVNRRFYELVREYHPDKYARSHNSQIRSLAEKIFVHIRKVHGELMAIEKGEAPPATSAARQSAPAEENTKAQSGAQRRRARAAANLTNSGASRATRSRAGGRKVSDVMERLRSRNEHSGDARAVSGAHKAAPPAASIGASLSSVRRLSPEQLYRNARSASEQGNYAKALDLLELARTRGTTGPLSDAYHHFLRYTQKLLSPAEAIDLIDAISDELKEEDREQHSLALTLAGHACRLEELEEDSFKYYQRAVKAWSANESASRWLRHMRKKVGTGEDKKGPFSSAFLNKLFTSGKSK